MAITALWTKMNQVQGQDEHNEIAWHYEEELTSPGAGHAILFPTGIENIAVTLTPSGGSGKVQATTSSIERIKEGLAIWVDWDAGTVTASTQDYCSPVTAIRQVNVSGDTLLEVRAQ